MLVVIGVLVYGVSVIIIKTKHSAILAQLLLHKIRINPINNH